MSILEGPDGQKSSKRIAGLASVGVGLAMALIDQFTDFKVSYEVWIAIYGSGMGLLGVGIFEYFSKKGGITPQGTVDPTKPGGPKT